ncbi:AMP-binding protein [Lutibacter maritimus]|uniref:O-succinylbenzoic acid--CoA ligase n=1 Tax=Lutibacter maritimus TaxID=593133 RepID=A0A1I6S0W0_9FLAO|nr:AMP-binding protein [Lutibacter maritimus]SFS70591.1 O-succinylbenzoic acid--CoA ligase [Lutibacter maritimus]
MIIENNFHKDFRLQGKSFNSVDELLLFSKTISMDVAQFLENWFNESTIIEVKTSGSTGTPKVIQLQKKHMINSAKATGEFFNLFENTTALLCMSVNFIAGKMMLVRALTLGWQLDIIEPTSSPLNIINKEYDFSAMVPLQVSNSLKNIHKIKKLIVGGGVVSNDLLLKIQPLKTEIFATYGMTETVTHIAIKKLNNLNVILGEVDKSSYKTLPNIILSTDDRGCLIIDAPKICDEKILTNDLVELISETEFKWLGRYDSIINSGGIKLIPEQIEEKLSKIIHERFFITGISDAVLGEKLVLIIEGASNLNLTKKVKQLSSLSKFEKPKEIYFISKFIETPTQKINRKETLKLLKNIC